MNGACSRRCSGSFGRPAHARNRRDMTTTLNRIKAELEKPELSEEQRGGAK